jgi:hypothetical protein
MVNLGEVRHMFELPHVPQVFLNILSCNIAIGIDEVADIEEFVFILVGVAM